MDNRFSNWKRLPANYNNAKDQYRIGTFGACHYCCPCRLYGVEIINHTFLNILLIMQYVNEKMFDSLILYDFSRCNVVWSILFFTLSVGFNTFTVPGCKTA